MEIFLRKLHVCENGVKLEASVQLPLHQIFNSGGSFPPTVNKIKMFTLMCMNIIKLHLLFCSMFTHPEHTHLSSPPIHANTIKNKIELNLPPIQGCFSFQRSHMSELLIVASAHRSPLPNGISSKKTT